MPQLSYSVSDLQQRVATATVGDLMRANNVLNSAKRDVSRGQKLHFKDLGQQDHVRWDVQHSHKSSRSKTSGASWKHTSVNCLPKALGMSAVHDASSMGQLGEGSQSAYCIMLSSTQLYEGKARTHLLDWNSSKNPEDNAFYSGM